MQRTFLGICFITVVCSHTHGTSEVGSQIHMVARGALHSRGHPTATPVSTEELQGLVKSARHGRHAQVHATHGKLSPRRPP